MERDVLQIGTSINIKRTDGKLKNYLLNII